jgi:hypothetical protein
MLRKALADGVESGEFSTSEEAVKPTPEQAVQGFELLRCFVWVVWRSGDGWDSQIELSRSVVSGGFEVDEVFESPSHSLC